MTHSATPRTVFQRRMFSENSLATLSIPALLSSRGEAVAPAARLRHARIGVGGMNGIQ